MSATLRVTFSKKGRYAYRSTLAGQATAGMKGIFSVVAAVAPTPTPTTTTTTTPYTPPTGPVGTANTTVTVTLTNDVRGIITLSEGTFPSGMVTFVITSQCHDQCSFHLDGVKAGALLNRNQTETWTVALPKGTYLYHCDMNPSFMKGLFTVTP